MVERPVDMEALIREKNARLYAMARAAARTTSNGTTGAPTVQRPQGASSVMHPPNSSSPLSAREQRRDSNLRSSSPNTSQSLQSHSGVARPETQASDHRRVPSGADSFKENAGEPEAATHMRRPDGQSRAFGNDITQFEEDERKRSEDMAANRRP